ncbi:MAG TPA: FAD-dependent oxidoreductase [Polyangiaceae bacterium]
MNAARKLTPPGSNQATAERFDVVVIGGGQAGLSVGYQLARRGLRFVILDAEQRIGDAWRKRWDSLRLFTPARFDSLVGMPFPAPPDSFPTRTEMADYLEAYAERFELPVRSGTRVEALTEENGRFLIQAGGCELQAEQVVVAMGSHQLPHVPELSAALAPRITQLHASAYKNPAQLSAGPVLIVGAGNSGAEIALELAKRGHQVSISGRDTGEVPFKVGGFWGRWLLARLLLRFVFHHILTIKTPMGRKARPQMLAHGGPLIRTRMADLSALGVERVARIDGTRNGKPELEDGRVLEVTNVIWCTGFRPAFSWIKLPIFDDDGAPRHQGGVVGRQPGLYFVGLNFLYSFSSGMIHGVGRDAARIAAHLAQRAVSASTRRG